jgi:hypothetical protein
MATMWILSEFVMFLSMVNHVDFVLLCQFVMVPMHLQKRRLFVKLIVTLLQVSEMKNVFTPSRIL